MASIYPRYQVFMENGRYEIVRNEIINDQRHCFVVSEQCSDLLTMESIASKMNKGKLPEELPMSEQYELNI